MRRTIEQRYENRPTPAPPPQKIVPVIGAIWTFLRKAATFLAILIVVIWALLSIVEVIR